MKDAHADVAPASLAGGRTSSPFADFFALTKPRLNFLVVATSAAGYYLGAAGAPELLAMAQAVAGTALVAGGAAVLNQVYERDTDALMRRTRMRPLPDGRVAPNDAAVFGVGARRRRASRCSRCARTARGARSRSSTLVVYLIVYTPMKRRSSLATLVGAVPGALPPLIGWTAAHGDDLGRRLDAVRDRVPLADSALHGDRVAVPRRLRQGRVPDAARRRAGRPADGAAGRRVCRGARCRSASCRRSSDSSGVGLLRARARARRSRSCGWRSASRATRTDTSARALFFGSITYLPLIWIAMIANKL